MPVARPERWFSESEPAMSDELRAITRELVASPTFQGALAAVEADPYLEPKEFLKTAGDIGLLGMDTPEEYGGSGLGTRDAVAVIEELSRAHAGLALAVLVQNSLTAFPIVRFGSEAQKRAYLPRMATGELTAAFGLSEPNHGSDAKGVRLSATRDAERGGWRLNGTKRWITNADRAGLMILASRTGTPESRGAGMTVFLVEVGPEVEGFSVPKPYDKLGQAGSTLTEPVFENVWVPDEAVLGQVGGGWDVINATLEHSRIWIAAQGAGIARGALDEAETWAAQREQFGRKLQDLRPMANHLAVLRRQVELSEFLVDKAARQEEASDPLAFVWASLAKLIASETCIWAAADAMLIHGGMGYVNEIPISRIFRDAAVLRIYEGAAHIQVRIIERYLNRDKIMALFPPQAALMRDPSELTPLPELIAEIESWQPSELAAV